MNIFAQSIYLARVEKGLSQKELARKAHVPQPNLSNIEKGRDFKVSTLFRIASALDISVDVLIKGSDPAVINKRQLFQRDNIEKVVSCAVHNEEVPRQLRSAVELISNITRKTGGRYTSKKKAQLSWYQLKKNFSSEEINTILSRVTKARRRAE